MVGAARFESGNYERAARLFEEMSLSGNFPEFLTVPAYTRLERASTAPRQTTSRS